VLWLFAFVLDHADSQRKAVYQAIGRLILEEKNEAAYRAGNGQTPEDWEKELLVKAEALGREAFEKFVRTCYYHFIASRTKLLSNERFVSGAHQGKFVELTREWVRGTDDDADRGDPISEDRFHATVTELRRIAPRATRWIDWWANPIHASTIFPAFMAMDRDTMVGTARSNNAAETLNRDEKRVLPQNVGLPSAIMYSYTYVKKHEMQYYAELDGYSTAPGKRATSRKKREQQDERSGNGEWGNQSGGAPPDSAARISNNSKRTKKTSM
jgi:hypothetical protein